MNEQRAKKYFIRYRVSRSEKIGNTELHTQKLKKNILASKRKKSKRRVAIEPVIGHLKHDYRMISNYLKGTTGDAINVMLAATAKNFKRIMNKWTQQFIFYFKNKLKMIDYSYRLFLLQYLKMAFWGLTIN